MSALQHFLQFLSPALGSESVPDEPAQAEMVREKHLGGKHDQKRHGWRFGSLDAARRSLRGQTNPAERAEYRRRAGMPAPKRVERPAPRPRTVKEELNQALARARPDFTPDDIDSLTGVMDLDRGSFLKYAEWAGIPNAKDLSERYFREQAEVSARKARERWEADKARSFSPGVEASEALEERTGKLQGKSYAEAARRLADEFDIDAELEPGYDPAQAHQEVSRLLNLAAENPVLAQTLRDQVRKVEFRNRPEAGSADAEYRGPERAGGRGKLMVYAKSYGHGSSVMIHELGHAAEEYIYRKGKRLPGEFGQGKVASMYGANNPNEDFAEWFLGMVGGNYSLQKMRSWAPEKFDYLMENIPGLKEILQ